MVKVLSRDAVQRMTGRRSSTTSVVGGVGSGGSGVTPEWVEGNYISKNFFNQLFTIHGTRTYIDEETEQEVTEEVTITPNTIADGEEYKLSNVEVSIGLWTQQFLSALGLNPGGGGGGVILNNVLEGINNTTFPSATPSSAGQAIVWDGSNWTFGTAGGGGGTVTSVGLSVPTGFTVNNSPITSAGTIQLGFATGYSLPTNAKQSNWDTAYGWGNHANAGYATQSWVTQQGYITSAALNGYLPLSGGTMTGNLHLGSSAGASPFIYFGDSSYVYIGEDADDHLTIRGSKGINFIVGSGYNVTINSANIATQSWVQQQGYLTQHQSLAGYATESWVNNKGYATQSWVQQQGYLTQHQSLAGYATESWVNNKGYATQSWVQQQGYLTSHQSVDGTFWGQSWNNHGSVTGNMTDVGTILQTGNYTLMNYQGVGLMIEGSSVTGNEYRATFGFHPAGNIAWLDNNIIMQLKANTSTHEYFVHINTGILQIGDARLVWDSANNALKVVKADGSAVNFYATGGVSALGYSS